MIRKLKGKTGTEITLTSKNLGWQSHTIRAALTGLRKAGCEIMATKAENGKRTRHNITAEPENTGQILNTYRTMCVAPEPEFRQLLQGIRTLDLAAHQTFIADATNPHFQTGFDGRIG